MNWKRILAIFMISSVISIINLEKVSAHEIETSGAISVLLHIDPIDEPIAQIPSVLYVEFADSTKSFKLSECACNVKIIENNKPVYSELLSESATTLDESVRLGFTFPDSGTYQIQIHGEPAIYSAKSFQSFDFNFAEKVNDEAKDKINNQNLKQNINYLLTGSIFGLFFGVSVIGYIYLRKR